MTTPVRDEASALGDPKLLKVNGMTHCSLTACIFIIAPLILSEMILAAKWNVTRTSCHTPTCNRQYV